MRWLAVAQQHPHDAHNAAGFRRAFPTCWGQARMFLHVDTRAVLLCVIRWSTMRRMVWWAACPLTMAAACFAAFGPRGLIMLMGQAAGSVLLLEVVRRNAPATSSQLVYHVCFIRSQSCCPHWVRSRACCTCVCLD